MQAMDLTLPANRPSDRPGAIVARATKGGRIVNFVNFENIDQFARAVPAA